MLVMRKANLLEIVQTLGSLCRFADALDGWNQQSDQSCYDRNDYEQLE
jgi:hypothetical protein